MKLRPCVFLLLATQLLFWSQAGSAGELTCPESIQVAPAHLLSTPSGWEVSSRSDRLSLNGMTLTIGKPAALTDLKGETYKVKGKMITQWDISGLETNAEGVWFSCSYGSEYVLLSQKVKQPVSECYIDDDASSTAYVLHCR